MGGGWEDSGGTVGSILSRSGLEEADDERFGGSEGVRRSGLYWRATAAGEERGGRLSKFRKWGGALLYLR